MFLLREFNIEIDESEFKNLKKSYIKEIVKEVEENEVLINHVKNEVRFALEDENFNAK